MDDTLTPQERAALIALEFTKNGQISACRVRQITGLSKPSVSRLMSLLTRSVIPGDFDPSDKLWKIGSDGLKG